MLRLFFSAAFAAVISAPMPECVAADPYRCLRCSAARASQRASFAADAMNDIHTHHHLHLLQRQGHRWGQVQAKVCVAATFSPAHQELHQPARNAEKHQPQPVLPCQYRARGREWRQISSLRCTGRHSCSQSSQLELQPSKSQADCFLRRQLFTGVGPHLRPLAVRNHYCCARSTCCAGR